MTDVKEKEQEVNQAAEASVKADVVTAAPVVTGAEKRTFVRRPMQHGRTPFRGDGRAGGGRPGGRGGFGSGRSDTEQKVLSIRRVARVTKGGKRFTFSVCLVLGDKKGSVGVGLAKAGGTSEAIDKAVRDAKRHMVKVKTTKSMSIPHETKAKYCSGVVELRPARGRGLIAGSAPRVVLALAGITDINAKIISGSKNKVNNARATWLALKNL